MTKVAADTRSIVIEREMPHPPEKGWRALTQGPRWNASGEEAAKGLKTVVTWTLTPTKAGVLVRMEQSGFRPEEEANYQGANYGWQKFIGGLERVAAGLAQL
jgi:uncharacterized protein YndB with AHSA1/START domain